MSRTRRRGRAASIPITSGARTSKGPGLRSGLVCAPGHALLSEVLAEFARLGRGLPSVVAVLTIPRFQLPDPELQAFRNGLAEYVRISGGEPAPECQPELVVELIPPRASVARIERV